MNHFANGGFHSSVFFQGVNHDTFSRAMRAQNFSGLLVASATAFLYSAAVQFARLANFGSGAKRRFSFRVDSIEFASAMSRSLAPHPGFHVVDLLRDRRRQVLVA